MRYKWRRVANCFLQSFRADATVTRTPELHSCCSAVANRPEACQSTQAAGQHYSPHTHSSGTLVSWATEPSPDPDGSGSSIITNTSSPRAIQHAYVRNVERQTPICLISLRFMSVMATMCGWMRGGELDLGSGPEEQKRLNSAVSHSIKNIRPGLFSVSSL